VAAYREQTVDVAIGPNHVSFARRRHDMNRIMASFAALFLLFQTVGVTATSADIQSRTERVATTP
jgi:hypothetical protein